jgi:chromosome segregation ATPase
MYPLQIQFSITDIIVLQVMAIVLGFIIHFALVNRRKLQAMIEENKKQNSLTGTGGRYADDPPVKPRWPEKKKPVPELIPAPMAAPKAHKIARPVADVAEIPDVLHDLTQSIRQQQKTLNQLLTRVDKLDTPEEKSADENVATIRALEEKEAELLKTKQQLSATQKVAGRVTEVYREFDLLQQKMAELEESASKTNELAMELDETQQAYDQLKKDLNRTQDKLHTAVEENSHLHQQLAQTEDKLSEANLQRQQLQKRVQLLENLNTELQQMSEANQKMKNELRRIAELESLLSLVSDERDLLLKKRIS